MIGLETQINSELNGINLWLRANKLSLNVDVNNINANWYQNKPNSLGLSSDENLSCKEYIRAISKRIASSIGALKRVRSFDYLKRNFW